MVIEWTANYRKEEAMTIGTALVIWIVCAVVGALIAEHRGGKAWAGAGLGLILGPLGVLIVAVIPQRTEEEGTREDRLRWEAEQRRLWRESGR
jgi:hypothetical protein